MHIEPKLNKPLLVFFKIVTYLAIFAIFFQVSIWIFDQADPFLAFIITMLIIVPNRGKFSNFIQKVIDRSFYRSLYELKKAAQAFSLELDSLLEYDSLVLSVNQFLQVTFTEDQYSLYLYTGSAFQQVNNELENKKIEFTMKPDLPALFEQPIQFYSIEKIWQQCPECQPLLKEARKTGQFSFFLPLQGKTGVTGFILFNRSIKYFLNIQEVKEDLLQLFKKTADVLEKAQIHAEIKRKSLESALLLDIVRKITSTLNLQTVLESIMDNLSRLVSYDAAAIFLLDKDKNVLQTSVARGYEKSVLNYVPLKLNQGISGRVIKTKEGIVTGDVAKDPYYYSARPQTKSQITVPIIDRGNAIGALVLESDELYHFTNADFDLLTIFSSLAAVSIRNAQLYEDSMTKKRLESELVVASKVQQTLLPKRVPCLKGLDIEVLNIPSQIVGGDLYEVFKVDRHRQGIAIGDVAGKGTPAAILMAVAYAGFKSLFNDIDPVVATVARLNNFLVETTTAGYFITFFFGIFDMKSKTLRYSNAGHNPPILIRKDKSIEYLDQGGMVLGFLADQEFVQANVDMQSGDYVCFYTDGVTEIKNEEEEEFGEKRLKRLLQENYGLSPRKMRLKILDEIKNFANSAQLQDDVTILIVYVK